MTEKNKDKINVLKFYNDYDNLTDFLHDFVICIKSKVYFRGTLEYEKALIPNAVKNRRKLKILEGYLDEFGRNEDPKYVKSAHKFIHLKSKVLLILDKVPIAFKLLNLAKTEANEEKKNLEVQLVAEEVTVISNTKEDSKEMEKEEVEENIKTDNDIINSESNKTEIYQKQNIKDNNEEEKLNKSEMYNNERQSTKQGSSNIALDDNVTDGIKLIDDKYINNSIKNTVEEKRTITVEKITPNLRSSKSSEALQNDIKEFLKSYNLKLDNFANNHEGDKMASEIIEREKRDALLESVKPSNKTTKQSQEENKSIKSKVSNHYMQTVLKCLNLEINKLELKLSLLEKFFKFLKQFGCNFTIEEYCSLSDEVRDETEATIDKYIHDIEKKIEDFYYVKGAVNVIKDSNRFSFLVQTTTTVSQNGNIVKVQNVNSISVIKTSDKSTTDDTFELDSKAEKNNEEDDELAQHLNKIICFQIDTDGKKNFNVSGQDFKASESKQVVFNCKNEKVKISFIDSQMCVSTENSEFHVSIRKPKSVDIQDDCTQTESTQ